MKLTERHYASIRNDRIDMYQTLDVVQEIDNSRSYIKFALMEARWRSVREAISYLEWAIDELKSLEAKKDDNY